MFLSQPFARREVRSTRRPSPARRPLVESLDGRQLLSTLLSAPLQSDGIVGRHIDVVALRVGQHIGVTADIQGQHIGVTADIVGAHIPTI